MQARKYHAAVGNILAKDWHVVTELLTREGGGVMPLNPVCACLNEINATCGTSDVICSLKKPVVSSG